MFDYNRRLPVGSREICSGNYLWQHRQEDSRDRVELPRCNRRSPGHIVPVLDSFCLDLDKLPHSQDRDRSLHQNDRERDRIAVYRYKLPLCWRRLVRVRDRDRLRR